MAADTHSASTITRPAVTVPSMTLRRLTRAPPIFQLTSSIASSSKGSTPVTHRITPTQATQEIDFSIDRTQRARGNVAPSTRTLSRITTNDSRIGIASLNTAGLRLPLSSRRAP